MSVFNALMLAISVAMLVIEILKFNQKNNRLNFGGLRLFLTKKLATVLSGLWRRVVLSHGSFSMLSL